MGKITSEFPSSARVIMALLSLSFVFMLRLTLDSDFVLRACGNSLFSCNMLTRSAVNFLYTSVWIRKTN
jgi:hypothetical protein